MRRNEKTARWREALGDATINDIVLLIEQRLREQDREVGISSMLGALNRSVIAAHRPGEPVETSCAGCSEMWLCGQLGPVLWLP